MFIIFNSLNTDKILILALNSTFMVFSSDEKRGNEAAETNRPSTPKVLASVKNDELMMLISSQK